MHPEIAVLRNYYPKQKPQNENELGFGKFFTDHMFVMDYTADAGWICPRIEPYAPLAMDPATMVLHYGQAVFEGLKAYRRADGGINLFRPRLNFERVNVSNKRMAIPAVDEDFCVRALVELIRMDQDWVPSSANTSLYIRPFIFAADPYLGVRTSNSFKFMIILSPSGPYYAEGLDPVSIYIEENYVRAVKGGTGFAKTPGNYASSIVSQEEAHAKGFSQVLWLDGIERKYIEEVGSMNVMFVRKGVVYTPALNGSILPGITRRSVIELCRHWGVEIREERIAAEDLLKWAQDGEVSEMFGCGTAAVISPVGKLCYDNVTIEFNRGEIGSLSQKLYDTLTGIQYGRIADELDWTLPVV